MTDEYLGHTEVARLLGVHPRTLTRWREKGMSPPWRKDPGGRYRYLRSDVTAWEAAQFSSPNGHHPPTPPTLGDHQ